MAYNECLAALIKLYLLAELMNDFKKLSLIVTGITSLVIPLVKYL